MLSYNHPDVSKHVNRHLDTSSQDQNDDDGHHCRSTQRQWAYGLFFFFSFFYIVLSFLYKLD